MKVIYYAAISLDGKIADSQHRVGWLDQLQINHQHSGYEAFFDSVDALIMGRKSFDFVYDYGMWPYGNKPSWVCSHHEVPEMEGCNLQPEHDPLAAIEAARNKGFQAVWMVGGGHLASTLIRQGLLTHLNLSVMPALLSQGIPLVDVLPETVFLHQTKSESLSGFTQIEYKLDVSEM